MILKRIFYLGVLLAHTSCDEKSIHPSPLFTPPVGSVEQVTSKFPDGRGRTAVYFDEKSHSKMAELEFHPNGQPKIHKKFVQGVLHGESWCYYDDGKPWSLNTFKEGQYHGVYKTWYPNGQLHQMGSYENGLPSGEWLSYYENGAIDTRGEYRNGEKFGVWSSYNLEGKLKREQDFSK
jgi:antitoxin component YwqK of YwqJK toxin-antitoxin module